MRYVPCILRYAGCYIIMGSAPVHLVHSMFRAEGKAIAALLAAGITHFQLANGVWYDANWYDASKENATR